MGAHAGEDAHLQLVQEPNKEAHKAGQQVSLCIKTPMQKMHKNSLLTVSKELSVVMDGFKEIYKGENKADN